MDKKSVMLKVVSAIIAVMTIFLIVDAGKALKQIKELTDSYGSEFEELVSKMKGLAVAELIFGIVTIVLAIITLIVSFASSYSDTAPFNLLFITIISIIVQKLVAIFQALALAKQLAGDDVTLDGTSTICLIFLIASAIAAIIAIILKIKENDKGAGWSGLVVAILLLVVIIIDLASSSSSDTATVMTIYSVLFIIMCLALGVFDVFVITYKPSYYRNMAQHRRTYGGSYSYRPYSSYSNGQHYVPQSQPVQPAAPAQPAPAQPAAKPVEKSPVEALRELKQLFDSGVITQEEYEEKRKKYVALL